MRIVLSFAHTIGEFGVVLMIGGNLPGITRTISISVYDQVQALDYSAANPHQLSGGQKQRVALAPHTCTGTTAALAG
jgi:ABC-type polar amino acid transport system ATPase subunit